ncbi:MAG TPA: hypothetical protein VFQ54_08540 [Thermomicrobiales bacterium]|nr:hypothetical protein [Thermomicrobiales bacterium]
MPASDPGITLSPDDLRVLLRIADLTIEDERLPALLAEVNTQLRFASTLDRVLAGVAESDLAAFDPSWPSPDATEDAR